MEPFLNSGGAFRPQIVKVGALSAPTQDMLLKYSLDLPYTQTGIYQVLCVVKITISFTIAKTFLQNHRRHILQ